MALSEYRPAAPDVFHLDRPAGWTVRACRSVGVTEFYHPTAPGATYPPGIAVMTLPETGLALDVLLRTGLFFLTHDLRQPTIERLGEQREQRLTWCRLVVQGRVPAPLGRGGTPAGESLAIVKRVALTRPGPAILVLALFGAPDAITPLDAAFEGLRRSVYVRC